MHNSPCGRTITPRRRANSVHLVEGIREMRDAFEPNRVRDLAHAAGSRLQHRRRPLQPHASDQVRGRLSHQLPQTPVQIAAALRDLGGQPLDGELLVAQVGFDGGPNLVDELPVRRWTFRRRTG